MRGSILRPLWDTLAIGLGTLVAAAGSSYSSATVVFSLPRSTLVYLRPPVPLHQELVAHHSLSSASAAIHETRDVYAMYQGVSSGMLEYQSSPEFYTGSKITAATCAECPSIANTGY